MDDLDLKGFSGRVRLFPLPGFVMFPHTVAPLHIFEPRYRAMTEHALEGDRLIAMVRLLGDGGPRPPIEQVGCLGRIIHDERLPDGRFNILLLGRKRVRLFRETDDDQPYRMAEAELIDDVPMPGDQVQPSTELIELLRQATGADKELMELLLKADSLGAMADIIAHAVSAPADWKQRMLAEPVVEARVAAIRRRLLDIPSSRPFPPPFSVN